MKKFKPDSLENAAKLKEIWDLSYPHEAKYLNIDLESFPPLSRTISQFMECPSDFIVKDSSEGLQCAMELISLDKGLMIRSFVVHPDYFRQGLGTLMMNYVLESYSGPYLVETGAKNTPAIALYEKFGFQIYACYRSAGILKVKMKYK
ncbi:MAG: GNAT family N-acetyltransferase [Flavobacteriaceae bacterium]